MKSSSQVSQDIIDVQSTLIAISYLSFPLGTMKSTKRSNTLNSLMASCQQALSLLSEESNKGQRGKRVLNKKHHHCCGIGHLPAGLPELNGVFFHGKQDRLMIQFSYLIICTPIFSSEKIWMNVTRLIQESRKERLLKLLSTKQFDYYELLCESGTAEFPRIMEILQISNGSSAPNTLSVEERDLSRQGVGHIHSSPSQQFLAYL